MAKEMLINVSAGEECRIALLENNKLEELYMERNSASSHVGNIYKGKVTNVEPSIQAAFVDFGIGRNGFLHISDLMPQYFGNNAFVEKVGQKLGRRDRPPIQTCLRKGDEIIVQIIKEGIGTKGPTLTTYLSVPGRVLVMMPGMAKMGVSKKIEDDEERMRLRKILDGLKPPNDCGFIIRTAGIGKSKIEIERDLKFLARLWEQVKKVIDKERAPVELYTEGDLVTRTVRDVFTSDVDNIIVDDVDTAKKIKDFIKLAMPRTKNKVELYDDQVPLFHKYEIEEVIEQIYSRRVPLPSGGSLVIDQTEAVVAIDVNSGKFRDHSDAETTAFKTDMEAADEIPRQLRLRDMGGVIICDFIDLRFERHRRELEERLFANLSKDRAKTRMLRMSQFGIVEMTRQRMRPSLRKSIYQDCTACAGQGMVKTPESMALDVMRKLRIGLDDAAVVRVQVAVHADVATYLLNKKRTELADLEHLTEKKIMITTDAKLAMDEIKFELYDARDGYIFIAELGTALPPSPQQPQLPQQGRGQQNRGNDRGGRQNFKAKHDRRDDAHEPEDGDDLFVEEEAAAPNPAARQSGGRGGQRPAQTEIEQTGNDDEAGVVDVDEGGDEMPGAAPGGFDDPKEQPFRHHDNRDDRGGRGGRRGRRGRGGRNRGDDRGPNGGPNSSGDGAQNEALPDLGDEAPHDEDAEHDIDEEGDGQDVESRDENAGERDLPETNERPQGDRNSGGQDNGRNGGGNGGGRGDNRQNQNRQGGGRGGYNNGGHNGGGQNGGGRQGGRQDNRGDSRQGGRNDGGRNNNNGGGRQGGQQGDHRRGQRPPQFAPVYAKPQPQLPPPDVSGDVDIGDDELPDGLPGNSVHEAPITSRPVDDREQNGRRRRRRGGRGRGRGGNEQRPPQRTAIEGLPNDDELDAESEALERNLRGDQPPVAESRQQTSNNRQPPRQVSVVKTGSTDAHLPDDEPADFEPVRKPQSFADLDELPDFED